MIVIVIFLKKILILIIIIFNKCYKFYNLILIIYKNNKLLKN